MAEQFIVNELTGFIGPRWTRRRSWKKSVDDILDEQDALDIDLRPWMKIGWPFRADDILAERDTLDIDVRPWMKIGWQSVADEILGEFF